MATMDSSSSKVGSMVARFEGLRGSSAPCARRQKGQHKAQSHDLAPYFARWWRVCQRISKRPSLCLPGEQRPAPLRLDLPPSPATKGSARARASPPTALTSPCCKRPLSPSMRMLPSPSRSRGAPEAEATAAAAAVAAQAAGAAAAAWEAQEPTPAWKPSTPVGGCGGLLVKPAGGARAQPEEPSSAGVRSKLQKDLSDAQAGCEALGRLMAEVDTIRSRLGQSVSDAKELLSGEDSLLPVPSSAKMAGSEPAEPGAYKALERRLAETEQRLAEAEAERQAWLAEREAMEAELELLRTQAAAPCGPPAAAGPGIDDLARAAGAFLRARAGRPGQVAGAAGQTSCRSARSAQPTLGEFSMHCDDMDEAEGMTLGAPGTPHSLFDEYEAMDVIAAASILCDGRGGSHGSSSPTEPEVEPAQSTDGSPQHADGDAAGGAGGGAAEDPLVTQQDSLAAQLAAAQQAVQALATARGPAAAGGGPAAGEAALFCAVGQLLGRCHELCRLCKQALPEEGEKGSLSVAEDLSISVRSTEASLLDVARVAGSALC